MIYSKGTRVLAQVADTKILARVTAKINDNCYRVKTDQNDTFYLRPKNLSYVGRRPN